MILSREVSRHAMQKCHRQGPEQSKLAVFNGIAVVIVIVTVVDSPTF